MIHRHRPLATLAFALAVAGLAMAACAADDNKQAWTDPAKAAAESRDFRIQGEYLASITVPGGQKRYGVQVVALGGGEFVAQVYQEGLPGDGWTGEPDSVRAAFGKTAGDETVFTADDQKIMSTADGKELKLYDGSGKVIATARRVERASPTAGAPAPDNAVVLFDGSETALEHWKGGKLDGDLLQQGATTAKEFGSFTLHLEFLIPFKPNAKPAGQDRANSGVYIHNRYEVQVLDAFGLPYFHQPDDQWKTDFQNDFGFGPASDRTQWTGALYKFQTPKLNASYPPLVWQTYDIDFTAAEFDADGKKTANARVTVRHNGVVIHDGLELPHGTGAGKGRGEVAQGPILLQDHGNPVRFRNIWIVPRD